MKKLLLCLLLIPTMANASDLSRETGYCMTAEQHVKDTLKAPSTAKFTDCQDYDTLKFVDHGNLVVISGYVDSENSFGAMIHKQWAVTYEKKGKMNHIEVYMAD